MPLWEQAENTEVAGPSVKVQLPVVDSIGSIVPSFGLVCPFIPLLIQYPQIHPSSFSVSFHPLRRAVCFCPGLFMDLVQD